MYNHGAYALYRRGGRVTCVVIVCYYVHALYRAHACARACAARPSVRTHPRGTTAPRHDGNK